MLGFLDQFRRTGPIPRYLVSPLYTCGYRGNVHFGAVTVHLLRGPGPLPTPRRGSRTRPGHRPVARTRHPQLFPPHGMHTSMRVGLAGTDCWNSRAWRLGACVCVSARARSNPGSTLIAQRAWGGGRSLLLHVPCASCYRPLHHTNEEPATNFAMEMVRVPPRPEQAPRAGTERQTPRPRSLMPFQHQALGQRGGKQP